MSFPLCRFGLSFRSRVEVELQQTEIPLLFLPLLPLLFLKAQHSTSNKLQSKPREAETSVSQRVINKNNTKTVDYFYYYYYYSHFHSQLSQLRYLKLKWKIFPSFTFKSQNRVKSRRLSQFPRLSFGATSVWLSISQETGKNSAALVNCFEKKWKNGNNDAPESNSANCLLAEFLSKLQAR